MSWAQPQMRGARPGRLLRILREEAEKVVFHCALMLVCVCSLVIFAYATGRLWHTVPYSKHSLKRHNCIQNITRILLPTKEDEACD